MAAAALAACVAFSPAAALAQEDGGDSTGKRLGRLEEQLNDLQAMVGALESLVKSRPDAVLPQEMARGQGSSGGDDLGARVDALETQIGALTSQLEQMTQQMNAIQAGLANSPQPLPPPPGDAGSGRQGAAPLAAPDAAWAAAGGGDGESPDFDTTVSLSAEGDMGDLDPLPPLNADENRDGPAAEDQPHSLMAAFPGTDAASLYNQGYGDLLRRDYAAAESSFTELVSAYPSDPLAGKAQYWLGETYYVRGQYKDAAEAFLKGYKEHKSSEKAPDSLLKLGMALAALGQKGAACSAFSELGTKFPSAPDYVREQATSERRKAGC